MENNSDAENQEESQELSDEEEESQDKMEKMDNVATEKTTEQEDILSSEEVSEMDKRGNVEEGACMISEVPETELDQLGKDDGNLKEQSDTWTPLVISKTEMDKIERMEQENLNEDHPHTKEMLHRRRSIKVTPNLKIAKKKRVSRTLEHMRAMQDELMEQESTD